MDPDFYSIQFNAKSIVIINSDKDNKKHSICGESFTMLPPKMINTDTLYSKYFNKAVLTYNINMPSSAYLYIDNKLKLDLFLIPDDTLYISLDLSDTGGVLENIKYRGKLSSINEYLRTKDKEIENDLNKRKVYINTSNLSLLAYADSVDAIAMTELNYLNNYNKVNHLPEWYLNYEKDRICYYSLSLKLDLPYYREFATNKKINVPNDYYKFLKNIKIDNNEAVIIGNYYSFLDTYFYKEFAPEKYKKVDYSEERIKKLTSIYLNLADSLLTGNTRDIYKCYLICSGFINRGKIQYADSIINEQKDKIKNPKYFKFLEEYCKNKMLLKPGKRAPSFYLPDENDKYKSLADYTGKVILLNFWFPGCMPCRKEIPFEKKLVDEFKNKDFLLINICMETPKEVWIKSLDELNMEGVNLYASGNWENLLIQRYLINGWPHYTLIDKEGNVYSNTPKRPSEGLSEDILKLLKK